MHNATARAYEASAPRTRPPVLDAGFSISRGVGCKMPRRLRSGQLRTDLLDHRDARNPIAAARVPRCRHRLPLERIVAAFGVLRCQRTIVLFLI
jgi:hypothetical protein